MRQNISIKEFAETLNLFFLQSRILYGNPVTLASFKVQGEWTESINESLIRASIAVAKKNVPEKYKVGYFSFFWFFPQQGIIVFFFYKPRGLDQISVNLDKIRTSLARLNYKSEYKEFLSIDASRDDTYTFKDEEFFVSSLKTGFTTQSCVVGKKIRDLKTIRPLTKNLVSRYYYLEPRRRSGYYWKSA